MEQGVCGSEGHAVVAADVGGQATIFKQPLKYSESVVFLGGRKRFTSEEKAAGVVGDGERVAVLVISQQELAFVVGAPEIVGPLSQRQRSALHTTTHATAAFDQAVAIQHGMDRAFGRDRNARESAEQALGNLSSTPAGVLALHVQDEIFHLEGKLVGVAIWAAAAVGQPLNATFLIAIKELLAGLTGNPKLSAKFRHRLAS
jgi:hypothetical protein